MGVVVQRAFGSSFKEVEGNDHQIGMICQNLPRDVFVGLDDRKL
jgi:hypothetical protein